MQVQPEDYVSKVADALRLPIERLLQQNVEHIPDLGAWLKPGHRLQACGASESAHLCCGMRCAECMLFYAILNIHTMQCHLWVC